MANFNDTDLPDGSPRILGDAITKVFANFVGLIRPDGSDTLDVKCFAGSSAPPDMSRDNCSWGYTLDADGNRVYASDSVIESDVEMGTATAPKDSPKQRSEAPDVPATADVTSAPLNTTVPSDIEFTGGVRPHPELRKAAASAEQPGDANPAIDTFNVGNDDADLLVLNSLCIKSKLFTTRLRAAVTHSIAASDAELAIVDLEERAAAADAADLRVEIGSRLIFSVGDTPIMEANYIRIGRFGDIHTESGTRFVFSWNPETRARMLEVATPHRVATGEAAESDSPLFITRVLAHVAEQLEIEHVYQSCDESGVFTVLGLTGIKWLAAP